MGAGANYHPIIELVQCCSRFIEIFYLVRFFEWKMKRANNLFKFDSPQLGVGADLAAGVVDRLLAALRQTAVPHLQILKMISDCKSFQKAVF